VRPFHYSNDSNNAIKLVITLESTVVHAGLAARQEIRGNTFDSWGDNPKWEQLATRDRHLVPVATKLRAFAVHSQVGTMP
jgi:hypothetical protein